MSTLALKFRERLNLITNEIDGLDIALSIANLLKRKVIRNTDNEVDFYQSPFAPHSENTRIGQILLDTGRMRDSWDTEETGFGARLFNTATNPRGGFEYPYILNVGLPDMPERQMLPNDDGELPSYLDSDIKTLFDERIQSVA